MNALRRRTLTFYHHLLFAVYSVVVVQVVALPTQCPTPKLDNP
jgi:hypothetical protein